LAASRYKPDAAFFGSNRNAVVGGYTTRHNPGSWPADRQLRLTVCHRFALSNPALVSAFPKKSFSNASWPIFACKACKSTGGDSGSVDLPNTSAAGSVNCFVQSII